MGTAGSAFALVDDVAGGLESSAGGAAMTVMDYFFKPTAAREAPPAKKKTRIPDTLPPTEEEDRAAQVGDLPHWIYNVIGTVVLLFGITFVMFVLEYLV